MGLTSDLAFARTRAKKSERHIESREMQSERFKRLCVYFFLKLLLLYIFFFRAPKFVPRI
jgi:hypothetical protein